MGFPCQVKKGTVWCFDVQEPILDARHHPSRLAGPASKPIVLICYDRPGSQNIIKWHDWLCSHSSYLHIPHIPSGLGPTKSPFWFRVTMPKRKAGDHIFESSCTWPRGMVTRWTTVNATDARLDSQKKHEMQLFMMILVMILRLLLLWLNAMFDNAWWCLVNI